jgi:hypothetical protein
MANITFLGLSERVLAEEKRPLSPSEIWKVAVAKKYDAMLRSQGKTPAQTLYSAIFTDARENPETLFVKVGDRPARYYLKKLSQEKQHAELEQVASVSAAIPEKYEYLESQLHPFLAHFIHMQFNARSKTIRHATSRKNEFGEWVHPDMIGVYYPDWRDEVINLSHVARYLKLLVACFPANCGSTRKARRGGAAGLGLTMRPGGSRLDRP